MLLLDRAELEVRCEGDTLALYESGQRRGTVPVQLVDRCVIHGAKTRLDSGVLTRLAEAGVTTIVMSPRNQRRVALVLGPRHNDAAVRLAQSARVMDDAFCRGWAMALVRAKLARQKRTLAALLARRPDARKGVFDASSTLNAIAVQLERAQARDATGPGLDSLRGFEGAAARAYFAGLAAVMPPALQFAGRNRRPPRDPVNACLSLGYTLLHAQAVQCCTMIGLDPLLGFYHRPAFGRESLASDLIEPLRPALDHWVWKMLASRDLRAEHFVHDQGACLLGKAGRQVFYSTWEEAGKPWRRWLRGQCRALASALRKDGLAWLEAPTDDGDEVC